MQSANYRIVGGERYSRLEKRGKKKIFFGDISLFEQKNKIRLKIVVLLLGNQMPERIS